MWNKFFFCVCLTDTADSVGIREDWSGDRRQFLKAQNIDLNSSELNQPLKILTCRLIAARVWGLICSNVFFILSSWTEYLWERERERSSFLSTLRQPERKNKREVCLIFKVTSYCNHWYTSYHYLTTGLLCDRAYICVRYCTYNKNRYMHTFSFFRIKEVCFFSPPPPPQLCYFSSFLIISIQFWLKAFFFFFIFRPRIGCYIDKECWCGVAVQAYKWRARSQKKTKKQMYWIKWFLCTCPKKIHHEKLQVLLSTVTYLLSFLKHAIICF